MNALSGKSFNACDCPGMPWLSLLRTRSMARRWRPGSPGCRCRSGSGSAAALLGDNFGGPGGIAQDGNSGGGAGSPGGAGFGTGATGSNGTGGVLLALVRGAVNLTTGHVLSANGMAGGTAGSGNVGGGGASGGGSVGLFYSGSLTGSPNLTATGGVGGTGYFAAGAGGAGYTQQKTFATMAW